MSDHILKRQIPSIPARNVGIARRWLRRIAVLAIAVAAIALAVDGQRWLMQHRSVQSIEYSAATCATDALYGEQQSTFASERQAMPADRCTNPGTPRGKPL
jgi:hypothetical protein